MAGDGSGVTLGFLKYVLGFDSVAFVEGADVAQKRLKKAQKDLQKTAGKFADIGKTLSLGITAPLAGFAAVAVKEATEATKAMAQVNAALASMGPVAGKTADQLKAASDALELTSLYEGDEILTKVTANLLTFGKVAGANFDRAQQAALNLSTRMGTDLQSSALMVGKALNDPLKGLTALTRVGIQFTKQQQDQIKTMVAAGNAAGAQAIILGELERQFGGAAEAAQNADPFNKANDAFKQMAETVGTALLPIIPVFTEAVVAVANAFAGLSPETQKWLIIIGGAAAVLGPVLIGIGALVSGFGAVLPLLLSLGPAFAVVSSAIGFLIPLIWSAVSALAAMALTPIGAVITAIALAVGAVYLAWKNWDKILPILQNLVAAAKKWLGENLASILMAVLNPIEAVRKGFFKLYDAVVGHSYIPDMVTEIGQHMARLDAVMVQPAIAAAGKTTEAFRALQQSVSALLERLFPEQARDNQYLADIKALEEYARQAKMPVDQLAEALRRLHKEYVGLSPDEGLELPQIDAEIDPHQLGKGKAGDFGGILDRIANEDFPDFSKSALDHTAEVAMGFARMAESVAGSLRNMVSAFKHGDIWDKIAGVAEVIGQVIGGIQGMGGLGGPQGGAGGFGGFRAAGGPTVPGKSYVVGEHGPEWFTPGARGFVTPNNDNGGRGRSIQVIPSPYFDVVVDGRVVQGAAPMAEKAAVAGSAGALSTLARRQGRRFP